MLNTHSSVNCLINGQVEGTDRFAGLNCVQRMFIFMVGTNLVYDVVWFRNVCIILAFVIDYWSVIFASSFIYQSWS